eukprot:6185506-Pleurochrysis_carterae.AAC.1
MSMKLTTAILIEAACAEQMVLLGVFKASLSPYSFNSDESRKVLTVVRQPGLVHSPRYSLDISGPRRTHIRAPRHAVSCCKS